MAFQNTGPKGSGDGFQSMASSVGGDISKIDNDGARAPNNAYFNNNSAGKGRAVENFLRAHAPTLGQVQPDNAQNGPSKASLFPSMIEHGHPADQRYALVREMVDGNGVIPGFGQYHATSSDLAYIDDKIKDAQEADFKAWFLGQMDLSTPEKQHYWQQKFPEVFQEKLNLLEKQLDIHYRLAKINLFGHRTMEDYMLSWALQKGYINMPRGPIFEPENLDKTDFHRGLFNVKKWFAGNGRDGKGNVVIDWKNPLGTAKAAETAAYPSFTGFRDFGVQAAGYRYNKPPAGGY